MDNRPFLLFPVKYRFRSAAALIDISSISFRQFHLPLRLDSLYDLRILSFIYPIPVQDRADYQDAGCATAHDRSSMLTPQWSRNHSRAVSELSASFREECFISFNLH